MNADFFRKIYFTLINKNNKKIRLRLLRDYIRLSVNYFIYCKLLKKRRTRESFLGYTINFFDYAPFYELFSEIFFEYIYYFESKKRTPRIIDCGANIGMATLFFKTLYPDSKIVCFEPDPITFKMLKHNIIQNSLTNVTLVNAAVSARAGKIALFRNKNVEGGDLLMSIFRHHSTAGPNIEKIDVSSERLSKYIGAHLDYLKLDIEGAEGEVLQEIKHKLKNVQELCIEYQYDPELHTNQLSKIMALLENEKYDIVFSSRIWPHFYDYTNGWVGYIYAKN